MQRSCRPIGRRLLLASWRKKKVRRGPGCPFKGSPGRSRRSEISLVGGADQQEERKGGSLRHPPLRSLFHTPYPAINRHKKTRPAVARRADFCYNGRRQEVLALPLASTREVKPRTHRRVIIPFWRDKSKSADLPKWEDFFMPIKDPEKKRAAQKRADEKRAGRTRNFATVVYPESAPADWMDRLTTTM